MSRIPSLFALIVLACSLPHPVQAATPPSDPSEPAVMRLDELLWREVQNKEGETLGSVSDVLVQMPSGRIVFIAVVPAEFFERPKAVPPGALDIPGISEAPLQIDLSMERWIAAPRLGWESAMVIKNTSEGGKIYGYYQQAWQAPDPGPRWGMTVIAPGEEARPPARYVSLKKLLLDRVVTHAGEQTGYIQDFLIERRGNRVTHALVSPQFTPLAGPGEMWFAVPVALLNPPIEYDAITVNSALDAFRRAEALPPNGRIPARAGAEIFRYPAAAEPSSAQESRSSR